MAGSLLPPLPPVSRHAGQVSPLSEDQFQRRPYAVQQAIRADWNDTSRSHAYKGMAQQINNPANNYTPTAPEFMHAVNTLRETTNNMPDLRTRAVNHEDASSIPSRHVHDLRSNLNTVQFEGF